VSFQNFHHARFCRSGGFCWKCFASGPHRKSPARPDLSNLCTHANSGFGFPSTGLMPFSGATQNSPPGRMCLQSSHSFIATPSNPALQPTRSSLRLPLSAELER
jgi:hypothetical protein